MTGGWQSAQGRVWELIMMGNDFFGLTKRPFFAEPIPEMYCPFGSMEAARVEISRCVERLEGVAFVTGHSGTGKTLLSRKLQAQFASKMQVILLNGKNLNHPKTFFESILSRLAIPFDSRSLGAMRDALNTALEAPNRFQSGILFIIDDAQATGLRVFEEIRQLLDRVTKPERGVRVVLLGDMSLEEKLSFPQLNSFSQRITTRCFLETMNRDETTAFLHAELEQSGAKKALFSRDVCREIHRFSEGVPRVTNQLADFLLIVAEEELKDDSDKNSESISDSGEVKFEEWDLTSAFPGDASGVDIFSEPADAIRDLEKKTKKDSSKAQKISREITVAMVRKAWRRLQQLPDETDSNEESISRFPSESISGNSSSSDSGFQPTENSSSESSIEFGSLDDDLDPEHSINLGDEPADDSTMIWSYDESEEVRDAVETANAIPEEWEVSAKENAQKEEREKNAQSTEKAVQFSIQKPENSGENTERVPEPVQSTQEIQSTNEEIGLQSSRLKSEFEKNDDLWDVYREHSNIHFPERKGTQWTPPSYSSSTPEFSGNCSPVSDSVQSVSNGFSSMGKPNGVPYGIRGVNYLPVPPVRPKTVEELIYNSIMDDTVHSMGLLRNILRAIQDENQKKTAVQPPAEYWYTLQDSTKNLMRQIARERLERTISQSAKDFSHPEKDFYQPESLVEPEIFPKSASHPVSVPVSTPISNPISCSMNSVSTSNSSSHQSTNDLSKTEDSLEDSQEMQEIAELRRVLQECRFQNGFDPNVQEKILDIISRLQTLNQYS